MSLFKEAELTPEDVETTILIPKKLQVTQVFEVLRIAKGKKHFMQEVVFNRPYKTHAQK